MWGSSWFPPAQASPAVLNLPFPHNHHHRGVVGLLPHPWLSLGLVISAGAIKGQKHEDKKHHQL